MNGFHGAHQPLMPNMKYRARIGTSRLVTLDMPDALSERVMNALKADPRTVDLRALAPHFYHLSERILELFEEEEMKTKDGSLVRRWSLSVPKRFIEEIF